MKVHLQFYQILLETKSNKRTALYK